MGHFRDFEMGGADHNFASNPKIDITDAHFIHSTLWVLRISLIVTLCLPTLSITKRVLY